MNISEFKNEHFSHRVGWLRAAVLGANDGIVSTASLIIGVASAGAVHNDIMLAGAAGLVAGAMSMAAGEYVSVSTQADSERADLEIEKRHLARNIEYEREELAAIYRQRGLTAELAQDVALALMEYDALGAHARDELGIHSRTSAKPFQAAFASAFAFIVGALLPLLAALTFTRWNTLLVVGLSSLFCLVMLGGVSARLGGAKILPAIVRIGFWGGAAMVVTAAAGALFERAFL
ncbi:VIT1/CCC1 transporter family protein [Teredinibacter purpureus]|uniref:VIT1/CCC1 transporter family protein n=1 Tax=Teredinibacter purpureus TaxID=2731756 RepID=UPI001F2BFD9C|nr:VIT family protein [Teredinibacter purpureus]